MGATVTIDDLGAELRRKRAALRLSLQEVESKTGVSAATLSRIERGLRNPDLAVVQKVADWLGVAVQAGAVAAPVASDAALKDAIAFHLRANKKLDSQTAHSIAEAFDLVMRVELEKIKKKR